MLVSTLIRSTAITLAGFVGQRYSQVNPYWVALTTILMMPPTIKIDWNRSWHRGVGTVLGSTAGFGPDLDPPFGA